MNNIFEKAARIKLRFQTVIGTLSVEQLWDLPLETGNGNLYRLAEELQTALKIESKPAKALAFFKKAALTDEVTELKFEIVKHIVITRVAEIEANTNKAVRASELKELDTLIAAKEAEAKSSLSLTALKAMRNQL